MATAIIIGNWCKDGGAGGRLGTVEEIMMPETFAAVATSP